MTNFEQVVDVGDHPVTEHGPQTYDGFEAKLYVVRTPPRHPRWAPFLDGSFDDLAELPMASAVSALLVVAVGTPAQFYAFAFGHVGRHLISAGTYERSYGLRAALNLMYPAEEEAPDTSRIRSVDKKRVADTTFHTRTQTSKATALEDFDVDRLRDILRNLTGRPADADSWGTLIVGGDALRIDSGATFGELGALCRRIEEVARKSDYKEVCRWVDDMRAVQDEGERLSVQEAIISELRGPDAADGFDLSPPEILDWAVVSGFQFHFDRRPGVVRPSFDLGYYLAGIDGDDLTQPRLATRHLHAVDGDGNQVGRWSVWRCLTGSVLIDGRTFVIDDGEIYEVASDFLADLDADMEGIAEAGLGLPECHGTWQEPYYNEYVAEHTAGMLLLDAKPVHAPGHTTSVELCDLLSTDGQFIHVKRHFVSKGLSHLFNQGLVSADTLLRSPDFRQNAINRIRSLGATTHDTAIAVDGFSPNDCEVVYAIVGRWSNRSLSQALPFFSKMTLRHVREELDSIGYRVSIEKVAVSV